MSQIRGHIARTGKPAVGGLLFDLVVNELTRDGLGSWHGTVDVPISAGVLPDDVITVHLEDGRIGRVLVTRSTHTMKSPEKVLVTFEGSGALERRG